MVFLLIVFLLFESVFNQSTNNPSRILVLSDRTFDQTIPKYENTLIQFTDNNDSCNLCIYLDLEFKAVWRDNKEKRLFNLTFAKIDVTKNPIIKEKYNITTIPSLKLIKKDGFAIDYTNEEKTPKDITNWLKRRLSSPYKFLKNIIETQKFLKSNELVIVFFGKKTSKFDNLISLFHDFVDIDFGQCETKDCLDHYRIKENTLILFKKFGDKEIIIQEDFNSGSQLRNIIEAKLTGDSILFTNEMAAKIFRENNSAIILYRDQETNQGKELEALFEDLNIILKGKLVVAVSDLVLNVENIYGERLGVTDDMPTVRLVEFKGQVMKKYKMVGHITKESVLKFIDDWKKGKITAFLKSQKVMDDIQTHSKMLVGINFLTTVMDENKDVLVLYYQSNVQQIEEIFGLFEELARTLKPFNKDLVFGYIDVDNNEFERFEASEFPTIRLFRKGKGKKKNNFVDFKDEYTYDELVYFLKQYATSDIKVSKNDL